MMNYRVHRIQVCVFTALVALSLVNAVAQEDEPQAYEPPRDFGVDVRPSVLFGITPEDGLLIGGGPVIYKFGFRRMPYVFRMQIVGGVALKTGAFKLEYTTLYPAVAERLSLENIIRASALEVRSFYGYGNDSFRDENLEEERFYRVPLIEYLFYPKLHYKIFDDVRFAIGGFVQSTQVREEDDRYFSGDSLHANDADKSFGGATVGVEYDSRDARTATTNGIYLNLEVGTQAYLFEKESPFQSFTGNLRLFGTLPSISWITVAAQIGAKKVLGDSPFYESAFIGGLGTLRGFNRERFAGDASAFGGVEVRFSLFKMKLFVPAQIGVFAFTDAGRVWVQESSPGGWHVDAGGGLSIAPLGPENTLTLSLANSDEGLFFLAGLGFGF